jgi:hypothetical protein
MGVGLVLGVLGVGVMVMMYKQIRGLKNKCFSMEQSQGNIYNDINRVSEELHRRIDGEIKRTDDLYAETNRYINTRAGESSKNFDEVYRIMDSRLDRLTSKFTSPVGDKQVIKD